MRAARTTIAIIVLGFAAAPAIGQRPGVQLKINSRVLEVGETAIVQLECVNTGVPAAPQVSLPDGLDLKLLNPTPSSRSFTQTVNGRRTQRSTYTFTMQVTGLKEGTHVLGPISVTAGGTTYETDPMEIVVRSTDVSSVARGDLYIFAELTVTPRSLYVTETFKATLRFGIRKVEIDGRRIDIDMLRSVLDGRASQLSVFADGRATRSERWLTDSNGVRHRYAMFTVAKQVRAEEVGDTQIGPVFLKANYPTRVRRGIFGGYDTTHHRRETARADAITIEVKAPPKEGRPDDYTGAIGQFSMTVDAKPVRVEQGQPITLIVSIRGTPLQGVAGPDLTTHPELASRFDFTQDELIGDIERGAKVFRRAIFPRQAGEQTIPPISWSFFDPRRERYVTRSSDPIDISVDAPAPGSSGAPVVIDRPETEHGGTGLTMLTGGLSPNFLDPRATLATHSSAIGPYWTGSLVLSPLAWFIVALTMRHRTRLQADAGWARRRRARGRAHARISRALRNGEPTRQLHELNEAVTGYLCDRYGLPSTALTPIEARSVLIERGLGEALAVEVSDFLEGCEAMRFAPGTAEPRTPAQAADDVRGWIKHIEKSNP